MQSQTNCDEVSSYITSSFESTFNEISNIFHDGGGLDLIKFWLHLVILQQLPQLSCVALGVLSIPAFSSSSERVFSFCGNTLNEKRSRLSSSLLNNLTVLRKFS